MLDARLVKLESSNIVEDTPPQTPEGSVSISEYVVEMDNKFGVLVEEITNLKDIVLKLQSYTMDVNRMLLQSGSGNLRFPEPLPYMSLETVNQEVVVQEAVVQESVSQEM
jgi:hypothetical protein